MTALVLFVEWIKQFWVGVTSPSNNHRLKYSYIGWIGHQKLGPQKPSKDCSGETCLNILKVLTYYGKPAKKL